MIHVEQALATIGEQPNVRKIILDLLADDERKSADPAKFRDEVRWPMIRAIMGNRPQLITLKDGLLFEVHPQSRIEKALLLSLDTPQDHVWEPQTTRLACALARDVVNVVVGGAYIGDQALAVAKVLQTNGRNGCVHAFEPNPKVFSQLVNNIRLNDLTNVKPDNRVLWDRSAVQLMLQGQPALSTVMVEAESQTDEVFPVTTITIDDYAHHHEIEEVDLIMLDTEGAEQNVLAGATKLLSLSDPYAPNVIFEVNCVPGNGNLRSSPAVRLLLEHGYEVLAIRDLQGNLSLSQRPLEVIALNDVYIAPVPHGFNMIATKDAQLITKYGLSPVKNLSPKLLSNRDTTLPFPPKAPALHLPADGLGLDVF